MSDIKKVCIRSGLGKGSIITDSDIKVRGLKLMRTNLSNDLRSQISRNMFRRKMAEILDQCKIRSQERRTAASERMVWLLKKYGGVRDDFVVTVEVSEYGDCKLFKKNQVCEREESSGPVIVCGEGEEMA